MRRMTTFLSLVPVLFVVIGLSACDNAQLTAPGTELTTGAQAALIDGVTTEDATTTSRVTVVYSGSRSIGTTGGTVAIADQSGALVATLRVPAGAVRQATVFTIEIDSNRQIHLLATANSLNDIGTAGFHKPVVLTFNTAYVDPASVRGRRIGNTTTSTATTSMVSAGSMFALSAEPTAAAAESVITVEMDSFSGYGPTTD